MTTAVAAATMVLEDAATVTVTATAAAQTMEHQLHHGRTSREYAAVHKRGLVAAHPMTMWTCQRWEALGWMPSSHPGYARQMD